ncbi:hypothetical protein KHA93_05490 [Bacillus sp. FJAT-49732]|uniref:Uncharacterized protein n=1 Tax=Lederbergia citrisecunda TaxID=2833583 RepID=A0A942TJB0_9BACI|nr:hypothetical protein [Lederbergia citrisecunda]MBS4199110.1 hypothetical protein [Lederbergia citrisecunda]
MLKVMEQFRGRRTYIGRLDFCLRSRKKWAVLLIIFFLIVVFPLCLFFAGGKSNEEKSYKSIVMTFEIEKKEHHIEPGKYIKMWVIGANANDNNPNKERYKVMIEDSRIYNLLEEDNKYFVNIQGVTKRNQSEYIYTFGQLGLVDVTQLTGKGKIQ